MEASGCLPEGYYQFNTEQDIARWFAGAHKDVFGNGPQGVSVTILDNYYVIMATGVLNKFEKSLLGIPEGPYRIRYTRNLLFTEIREELVTGFQQAFRIPVKDIRYCINVEPDKSFCIIVS